MSENGSRTSDSSSKWNYNAPRYVDFSKMSAGLDEPNVEDYFNVDHEAGPFAECLNWNNSSEFQEQVQQVWDVRNEEKSNTSDRDNSEFKGEELDTITSPRVNRGRSRVILAVNEERKRLSMSVDRGKGRSKRTSIQRNQSSERSRPNTAASNKEITKAKMPSSQSSNLSQSEMDIVDAITEGVSEEVHLEGMLSTKSIPHKGIPMKPSYAGKLTQTQPFSFEKRDQQLMVKKETYIKKTLAIEKRAREFKAQPFPEIIYNRCARVAPANLRKQKNMSASHLQSTSQESLHTFKARPASVLHKEPFRPVKPPQNVTETAAFELNTEKRAVKRTQWEQYIKDKEHQKEEERQRSEKERLAHEEANLKRLRAKLVHKPLPMPSAKPAPGKPPTSGKENRPTRQKKE